MGPWRAAERFLDELSAARSLDHVTRVVVELYGSLAKTGKGHGTDVAVMMGLSGENLETCDTGSIPAKIQAITETTRLHLLGEHGIPFEPKTDIIFHYDQILPFHPNGIRFVASLGDEDEKAFTYYSVGGGFVVKEGEAEFGDEVALPAYPCHLAQDIIAHCHDNDIQIWEMVWQNERTWRADTEIKAGLHRLWETMVACAYRGCHTEGKLPGGLNVTRRAAGIYRQWLSDTPDPDPTHWIVHLRARSYSFKELVKLVSCLALAVNEENASFGRVVTAPTNGAAGVLPAVLLYYTISEQASDDDIHHFLLVASEIGSLFKKGATISAALGGCQAEIGVSSAMAAGALTECMGGSVEQALMAAEIAMEHHLGLTCDPVGGLVQIPCIERNAMGAMKAITAANIALESSPQQAKVSLDAVIKTLWETAQDMSAKYKETAEGGLAIHIPVNVIEC